MTTTNKIFLTLLLGAASATPLGVASQAHAATEQDLNRDSQEALQKLYRIHPFAKTVAHSAKAILIFPRIVKVGLVFGGAYGEGEMLSGSTVDGYYNSVTGSWGLQAGGQSYSYVVFLMTDKAVQYVHETHGWEIGVGPTVVVVDEGVAKNLSSSTLKDDAYAFIYRQKGLMAGLTLEGTKISHIKH
jgi:lipid-binding SYLF domain-containing protein